MTAWLIGCIACTDCKDAAYCCRRSVVCVRVCVCLLDRTVSRTKAAEPIEVPFGIRTRVVPKNPHPRPGFSPPLREWVILGAHAAMRPYVNIFDHLLICVVDQC